ncbi:hypothetical protein BJV78DRAFT_450870 [Lactifluus subvellereus]|nr:hypothetical protein BJV78DRAFT_450870 [Lactifluus subvellereus]
MMEDVIEISPSPESLPRNVYRPLRRKRDPLFIPDGDESAIELTDSTDSQSSTPCKRVKTLADAAGPSAGPSNLPYVSVARTRALSPRPMGRAHKFRRGHTPAPLHAAPVSPSPRATSPVQKPDTPPTSDVRHGAAPMEPLMGPGNDQLPNHALTPASEPILVGHEPPLPIHTADSEVTQEPDERLVERVREIVPDVLPSHVFELLAQHKTAFSDNLLGAVIHMLLEDPSYPKDIKGKGKERAAEKKLAQSSGDNNMSIDHTYPNADRPVGPAYRVLSLKYLYTKFPNVDKTYILEALSLHKGHYAPTYLYLLQHGATPTSVVPISPKPGRRRGKANKSSLNAEDLVKEHSWLVEKLESRRSAPVSDSMPDVEAGEGDVIECGCCFSSYSFNKMAQCTDTHLFCTSCVTSYVSARLGEQNSDLRCIDISGCKMSFPDSELRRVLPGKLFELYEHIRQCREIELAELEGLEGCPFCDFKVVMDVDFQADKVLRCQNEECGKISCRKCKEEDHLPKSCEEKEEDKKLDGKHVIEEAMTRALMRNCPKCKKAFVKEYGCNKMTCTYCYTTSCYVCRSIISGYGHFDQSRPGDARRSSSSSSKKCPLWDSVEDRHTKEVAAAADRALKEYKALHPDVRDEDIRVELPPPPPNLLIQNAYGGRPLPPPPAYVQVHHAHNAHVPIAHPVMALPLHQPVPPFNFDQLFAPGPPDFPPGPPQVREAQMMFPIPAPYHPLLPPPPAMLPLQPPPLQPPPLQQALPPMQPAVPAPRRMPNRGRRKR